MRRKRTNAAEKKTPKLNARANARVKTRKDVLDISFAELFAPVAAAFRASGVTEDELDAVVKAARIAIAKRRRS